VTFTATEEGRAWAVPYITFAWHPTQDSSQIAPIVDALRSLADAQCVSFYISAKEENEKDRVIVRDDVVLSFEVVEQLRALATKADVTIYVHTEAP
jgi:hypothetical protein